MNGGNDKKQNQQNRAFELMQALSGVDGKLLERSERPASAGRIYKYTLRYGGLCAACLCLFVIGVALYMGTGKENGTDLAGAGMQTKEFSETKSLDGAMVMSLDEKPLEADTTALEENAEAKEDAYPEEAAATLGETADETIEMFPQDSVDFYPYEQYIPNSIPVGYEIAGYIWDGPEDGKRRLYVTWAKGEDTLTVTIRVSDVTDGANSVSEPDENGYRNYMFFYPEGICLECESCLPEEEIMRMFLR